MAMFELTLRGFNGETDRTDHLILWVDADMVEVQVRAYLSKEGLYLPGGFVSEVIAVPDLTADDKADFVLPSQLADLKNRAMKLVNENERQEVLEAVACRYISGNWGHIFASSRSERDLRFVFDTETRKVVAMQIRTGLGYENATLEAIADVQDSLLTANEEVLENPVDNGLEPTNALPAWAMHLISPC